MMEPFPPHPQGGTRTSGATGKSSVTGVTSVTTVTAVTTVTGVTGATSDEEEEEEEEGGGGSRPPRPRPKRPRLRLGPHVPSAPVYSAKVSRCFPLCPTAPLRDLPPPEEEGEPPIDVDADEESAGGAQPPPCPVSPPSPRYRSRRTQRIIKAVDERLRGLSGLVGEGPEPPPPPPPPSPPPSPPLWLKVRCRGRVHRLPLPRREPLQGVLEQLGGALGVPPGRILLLLRDRELEPSATPQGLGLGVADILEGVVAGGAAPSPPPPGELRLTLRGQERGALLRLRVPKGQPLRGAMERYRAVRGMGARPLTFLFEGRRLGGGCTPEELGLEQDDVIEVWG